jgi:hypothetical protein
VEAEFAGGGRNHAGGEVLQRRARVYVAEAIQGKREREEATSVTRSSPRSSRR